MNIEKEYKKSTGQNFEIPENKKEYYIGLNVSTEN
jgi:hypothetical protein